MYTVLLGWFCFWMTYWLAEGLFPYDEKSQQIIPSHSVQSIVARNMFLSFPYSLALWHLTPNLDVWIPNSCIIRFILSILLMDGWFYIIHRLLHHKWFYHWHKQHHQFHIPYPLVTVYCSPIEALLCDVTSIGLGPALFKMQGVEIEIWMIAAALHSLSIHSTISHGRDHNIHHAKNLCNFGLFPIFDRIFGTYQ